MSVGDALLDSQHKQLVDLLNSFSDLMTPQDVARSIAVMLSYADRHFLDEEAALARAGYPLLEQQRSEHRVFMLKAAEFSDQSADRISLHIQLVTYLTRWLIHHILCEDMKFKPYLLRAAQPPTARGKPAAEARAPAALAAGKPA
jgi:hemerythrin